MSLKIMLILAGIGHVICGVTDCLFTYTPNGKFTFQMMNNPEKMSDAFAGMPLKRLQYGMLFGIAAMLLEQFGYIGLGMLVYRSFPIAGIILYLATAMFFLNIVVHHVACGTTEWFYVRCGRTKEMLEAVTDYFKSLSMTMIIGYISLLVYMVVFLLFVLKGCAEIPIWGAIFNTLPLFLVLAPTKLPAKGNIAGAVMFFALAVVIQ